MEIIRQRIKECIEQSKMKQKDIAAQLGIKQQAISEYVNMKSLPALDTLAKLCILLDVSADYILGIEDYSGKKNINIFM